MKKILLTFLLVVLLIGTVSAFEFDNVKSYNEETKTVEIRNSVLGLPFFQLDTVAEIQLNTPLNYLVPRGYQMVAEFEVTNYEDYNNALKELELFDKNKDNKKFERDYDFKKLEYETILVDDWRSVQVGTSANGTAIYESQVIGNHEEQREKWIKLTNGDFKKNDILTIGIFTEVEEGDKVEWIPNFFGVRIDEWAGWEESWEVDMISYYNFEQTSGDLEDVQGDNDGVNVNETTQTATGQISNAWDFELDDENFVNLSNDFTFTDSMTISTWVNLESLPGNMDFVSKFSGNDFILFVATDAGGTILFFIDDDTGLISTDFIETGLVGAWNHIVAVANGTHISLYHNGTFKSSTAQTGDINITSNDIHLGRRLDGSNYYDGLMDETFISNRSFSDAEILALYNAQKDGFVNGSFALGADITLNAPIDNFNTTNQTVFFNASLTDSSGITNVSLFLDGVLNETNSSGINNVDYFFTKTFDFGEHDWSIEAFNDGDMRTISLTRTFNVVSFTENSQTFNASAFETESQSFTINITTNGSTPSSAKLIYDGTTHTGAAITNLGGNFFNITKAIDIPLVNETKSFFFNVTINGNEQSSVTQNQLINLTNYAFCTNTSATYFNVSFKNETLAEEAITAQIRADWNFWIGGGTVFKTLSHVNVTENADYNFCLVDTENRTLQTNVTIIYDNSISEQRNFLQMYTLTNDTTNQTLFLLPTADGLFITFQTVTVAEQIITGVSANATKSDDLIESGITDGAGLVTFFLDPDTTYTFNFFKTGFDLVTTSLKPTQTSFTITMGSEVIQIENDTTKGITYKINPLANVLSNNTETEFNLTFGSSFFLLDNFGFALKNSTGDIFNATSSTTGTGGFLSRQLNTGNNLDIIMEIFWTIGGNQTNITRIWLVLDTSDEGFSIKTFFDDLAIYLTSGMFGLTDFGLGIIIFGIILLVTGILAARFGNIITNPPGISLIIFSLVLFFDVGLGIMPNPINAVPNFPTIFVGLIFLGTLLKEGIK